LTEGHVDWSGTLIVADRKYVALLQSDGQMDNLNIRLTDEQSVDIDAIFLSPDKRYLAITAYAANQREIIVYNIQTGRQVNWPIANKRIDGWYDHEHLFISPTPPDMVGTGKLNVFTGEIDLIFSPSIDNRPMDLGWETQSGTIYWNDWREQYSPDNRFVFYRSENNLVLVNRENGSLIWETESPLIAFPQQAVWQPNGAGLAYLEHRLLENIDPEFNRINDLFYLTTTGNQKLLSSSVIFTFIWSPDSTYLAFTDTDYSSYCLNIVQVDQESEVEPIKLQIPTLSLNHLWVSETQLVVRLNGEIWVIDVNSKVYMPITTIGFRIIGVL
jgi:hypothetical protein